MTRAAPSRTIPATPAVNAGYAEDAVMQPEDPVTSPAAKLAAGMLINDVELADLLGASLQTVRNWRWRGEGPRFVKLGGRMVRYRSIDVAAFLEGKARAL